MSPAEAPQDPIRKPATSDGGRFGPSQRIALATLARAVGEIVAKLASLVFFVAIARELGQDQFGDFIYGASLSAVVLIVAGLGMDELIAREVSKDRRRVDDLLWNVVTVRGLMIAALLVVIAGVVTVQGYPLETRIAILLVGLGIGIEELTNAFYAVFQGHERQQFVATSLIVNRISTAALGVAVLLAGGGLVAVSAVYAFGSALGIVTAYVLMHRYVVRPRREVDRGRWERLVRVSFPLGLLNVLAVVSLRSTVVLLAFLGSGSVQVGEYGAAFRLIESTLFISWSFSNAALPWFSRHPGSGPISIARGFEMALKAILALMLPVTLALALFADPVIETLYGADYDGAVAPLRILAAMTVLVGINGVVTAVLVGRDRPRAYTIPATVAIAATVVIGLILIPPYDAVGAALTAVISGALLATLTIAATTRLVGAVSPLRIVVAPLVAGGLMVGVAELLVGVPWALAAVAALAVYAVAFLAVERIFFPGDFAYYSGVVRVRRAGRTPA